MAELERRLLACAQALSDALDEAPEELSQERAVYEAQGSTCAALARYGLLLRQVQGLRRLPRDGLLDGEGTRPAQGEAFIRYTETPLDITALMDEAVFTKFRAVDLHLGHALGGRELRLLEGPRGPRPLGGQVETAVYPSPFPFRTNALLAVDTGAPGPESPAYRGLRRRGRAPRSSRPRRATPSCSSPPTRR